MSTGTTATDDGVRPPSSRSNKDALGSSGPAEKELPPIPELVPAFANGHSNGSVHAQQNGNGTAGGSISPGGVSPGTQISPQRPTEAADYLNGGQPHETYAPDRREDEGDRGVLDGPDAGAGAGAGAGAVAESPPVTPGHGRRRSVQFSRSDVVFESPAAPGSGAGSGLGPHQRQGSWDAAGNPSLSRQLMTRIKALAAQGGLASPRTPASSIHEGTGGGGLPSTSSSPTLAHTSRFGRAAAAGGETTGAAAAADHDAEADADAEETADEAAADSAASRAKKRKKRMYYRPRADGHTAAQPPASASAPNAGGPGGISTEPSSPLPSSRHLNTMLQRRATMPDQSDPRGGLSEGEGRDHLSRQHGWRRGGSWVGRSEDADDGSGGPAGRTAVSGHGGGHVRRMTVFGGGVSDGDAMTPRRAFFGTGDRATTFGAQKWRQVKNTLKLLRQKRDDRFDYLKSAELMAELRAGAPAVLMLASMIQRDEHGNKRIPVLLEQVKLHIRDSTPVQDGDSERHWLFTIDLEYGSGPSRMCWTVKRTIREIIELHWKYKLALRNDKYLHAAQAGARPKQPRFPISAFPYVRGLRGVKLDDEEEGASARSDNEGGRDDGRDDGREDGREDGQEDDGRDYDGLAADGNGTAGEGTAGEGTATEAEGGGGAGARPIQRRKKSRMAALGMSRRSSALGGGGADGAPVVGPDGQLHAAPDEAAVRRRYVDRQQRMLEKYLNEMVHWLMFRADSNRLCRFLELSALGVRLAAEGSYHGKECFLHIQSSKGLDFRRVLTPGKVIERHSRKWFLVRQSYIVCVESPENMNIYDVYLVDPKFLLISKKNKRGSSSSKALSGGGGGKHPGASSTAAAAEMDLSEGGGLRLKHHTLTLLTSERKVKLWARNQHLIGQFEESIVDMLKQTPWHRRNRFDSFAPVRTGVFAQWLVDGRDYMWNVSRAIAMAKDVIYIHDWWLSPELYMRRPACISQKWRLDRLLQRKASEGVKIFVIVYRNVEAAIPIDSEYTKFSLLNLHPNIFVQRSPNQFKKNQFFFAHHEKICIVDHDVAFVGGIDLCFGRWDSPQHSLVDDKPTGFELDEQPKDADHTQLWPGKDYSNPRVQDFFSLREPYKEMYDRTKVPRMPWHDVGMQVVGQPARDLTRHFVQRWNYVRRGRKPTRPTPFLLPPPDYRPEDLASLGLTGTCEVQILRSASAWSLGITDVECSIQTAYISMIEESEHFVYMENQFFITSTETLNVKIVNRIGDALVDRILRAHRQEEDWRCVIVIPLMPGFQNSVADQEGTSVRLILQCQYRSICRGDNSIFGRLRAAGVEPEEYIQFFSLRQWGKINNKTVLTTEQLYIHAKTIVVDDRVALIGSANINERSLLGDRDSEVAAVVRDSDMIASTMAGRPYRVGRFAHTLRLRLMQEHLGLDTDELMEDARREAAFQAEMDQVYDDGAGDGGGGGGGSGSGTIGSDPSPPASPVPRASRRPQAAAVEDVDENADENADAPAGAPADAPLQGLRRHSSSYNHNVDLEGYGTDEAAAAAAQEMQGEGDDADGGRDSEVVHGREVLVGGSRSFDEGARDEEAAAFSTRRPRGRSTRSARSVAADIRQAHITKDCMRDPLDPAFYDDVWNRVAENNTKIYRRVFRCLPDSEATNWHDFQEFIAYGARFQESMEARKKGGSGGGGGGGGGGDDAEPAAGKSESGNAGPPGSGRSAAGSSTAHARHAAGGGAGVSIPAPRALEAVALVGEKVTSAVLHHRDGHGSGGGGGGGERPETGASSASKAEMEKAAAADNALKRRPSAGGDEVQDEKSGGWKGKPRRTTFSEQERPGRVSDSNGNGSESHGHAGHPTTTATTTTATTTTTSGTPAAGGSVKKRRRAATRGSRRGFQGSTDELLSKAEAEELLSLMQGQLVQFPYDWLLVEEGNGNWLYQVDQVAPLQIYN